MSTNIRWNLRPPCASALHRTISEQSQSNRLGGFAQTDVCNNPSSATDRASNLADSASDHYQQAIQLAAKARKAQCASCLGLIGVKICPLKAKTPPDFESFINALPPGSTERCVTIRSLGGTKTGESPKTLEVLHQLSKYVAPPEQGTLFNDLSSVA